MACRLEFIRLLLDLAAIIVLCLWLGRRHISIEKRLLEKAEARNWPRMTGAWP